MLYSQNPTPTHENVNKRSGGKECCHLLRVAARLKWILSLILTLGLGVSTQPPAVRSKTDNPEETVEYMWFNVFYWKRLLKIKSVAYISQGTHTGQLDFCNWLVGDGIMWLELCSVQSTFLIISVTSQSSSYPIVLTRLGGPVPRLIHF